MQLDLTGKTAGVCGSTQGMGLAIARQLAEQGAEVVLLARNAAKLNELVATLSVQAAQNHRVIVADFSAPDGLKSAVEQQPQNIP